MFSANDSLVSVPVVFYHTPINNENHIFTNIGGQVAYSFQAVGDPDQMKSHFNGIRLGGDIGEKFPLDLIFDVIYNLVAPADILG